MNGVRLTTDKVINNIKNRCNELNYEFLGFNNDKNIYINNKTYLMLKCNICNNTWKTTSYDKFVNRKRKCPFCYKPVITENEKIKRIENRCNELNYKFLEFNGKERITLKCNKCNHEWCTTTYNNLMKLDRNSHSCGRNNPSSMSSENYNENDIIFKINKKLEDTNLKFIDFVNKKYINYINTKLILKCDICGEETIMSYKTIILNKIINCVNCQYNGKLPNDEAIQLVQDKCKFLNYTFLGFDNNKNYYDGKDTKLILKCNVCGFIWKTTNFHRFVKNTIKCVNCEKEWKLEKEIKYVLNKNKISYEFQKRFPWLKNKISLSIDFYLPEYNLCIECQGRQHFEPVSRFGGDNAFKDTSIRDKIKKKLCNENGIKILYYSNLKKYDKFLNEEIIKNEKQIIEKIYE